MFIAHAKKTHTRNKAGGFTLIEVLVAIAVIATVGFVPISIVTEQLIQNALTPDRVRASLLAQEAVEYVRHDRDTDVLDKDGGKWFESLYTLDCSNQDRPCYRGCTVYTDEWVARGGNPYNYCTIECFSSDDPNNASGQDKKGECGTTKNNLTYTGFIAGFTPGGLKGSSKKTCDGEDAEGNGDFTATLSLVIPREEIDIRYAIVAPCISWKERNGAIKKTELQEAVFQWIQKKG